MPGRRHARELAMQALFGVDVGGHEPGDAIAQLIDATDNSETRQFVNRLVFGVIEHRAAVDAVLVPLLRDWTLDRLPILDRIILRMALFEMRFGPQTPPAVAIDEAVELAKRFSTEDSSRFINGVLAASIGEAA